MTGRAPLRHERLLLRLLAGYAAAWLLVFMAVLARLAWFSLRALTLAPVLVLPLAVLSLIMVPPSLGISTGRRGPVWIFVVGLVSLSWLALRVARHNPVHNCSWWPVAFAAVALLHVALAVVFAATLITCSPGRKC